MKKLPGEKEAAIGLLTLPVFNGDGVERKCLVCVFPTDELYVDVSVAAGMEKKMGVHKKCAMRYLATHTSGGKKKRKRKVSMGGSP